MLVRGVQHTAVFTASYYGLNDGFDGKKAANGGIFNKDALTAAHKTLPFGTILKVTYPKTGKSVTVRINDRGPYIPGRDLDLSYGAAKKIGLVEHGIGQVKVTVVKWGTGETRHHE
ncbi:MAG TPA: septal ring lytic transglycosylase RlpA family protein [Candidatus Marinimicrobia bacterium]|nr:septal ring lytic transglycosylase RlpA family protein [Candidatus Neomarinimicrobiota bacterium]